jgi:hypothetical protein
MLAPKALANHTAVLCRSCTAQSLRTGSIESSSRSRLANLAGEVLCGLHVVERCGDLIVPSTALDLRKVDPCESEPGDARVAERPEVDHDRSRSGAIQFC